MNQTKQCNGYGRAPHDAPLDAFARLGNGHQSRCKSCMCAYNKDYYRQHKLKENLRNQTAYKADPERHRERAKQWRADHPDEVKRQKKDDWRKNRERNIERQKAWVAANPERRHRNQRASMLWRNYRMTLEQYDALLKSQDDRCAICGCLESETRFFVVDHCHESKEVRGVLCNSCNLGLGKFHDNYDLLMEAADYLIRERVHQIVRSS